MRHIHVGDVGTVYRIPILAADILGDPATATTRQMMFNLPQGVITKDLDGGSPAADGQVVNDGEPAKTWFFVYTVQPDDGIGSPADFHAEAGDVSVQVHLEWPAGTPAWSSDVYSGSVDDLQLKIYPNLT